MPSSAPVELKKNVRRHSDLSSLSPNTIRERIAKRSSSRGAAKEGMAAHGPIDSEMQTPVSKRLDSALYDRRNLEIRNDGPPLNQQVVRFGSNPYDGEILQKTLETQGQSLAQLTHLIHALERGNSSDLPVVEDVTRRSLAMAIQDLDIFVRLGIHAPEGEYPVQHSLAVGMLAAAIGINLGWDANTVKDLGMGCIIHDLGMLRVSDKSFRVDRVLNDNQFEEISRHPFHTFELIESNLESIPLVSRMVAFQIHERCNGNGYPRRRTRMNIHPAARVAAIADVYVALVSHREHRPALMPYYAMLHLLHGVKEGHFESNAVRALLETVSLFPIGSHLELSDGRIGTVLRSNQSHYDRPVVELWRKGELDASSEIVDLLNEPNLSIRRPLPKLVG